MTKLEFDFKYSLICGEDPIGECTHNGNIEVEGEFITSDSVLDKIKLILENISADVLIGKMRGDVYEFGTAKKEELIDDIGKLIQIELPTQITAYSIDLDR